MENNNINEQENKKNTFPKTLIIIVVVLVIGIVIGVICSNYNKEKTEDKPVEEKPSEEKPITYNKDDLDKWIETNTKYFGLVNNYDSIDIDGYSNFLYAYLIYSDCKDEYITCYDNNSSKPIKTDNINLVEISKEDTKKLFNKYFGKNKEFEYNYWTNSPNNLSYLYTKLEDDNNYYIGYNPAGLASREAKFNSSIENEDNTITLNFDVYSVSDSMPEPSLIGTKKVIVDYEFKIISIETKLDK